MKRFRVGLTYDGTDFCGWGAQPGLRSIQKTLEEACKKVFSEVGEVTAAGRTDAGVHATGQTVHLDLPILDSQDVLKRLNAVLPEDLAAHSVKEVLDDFHARYQCLAKRYVYSICNSPTRPVRGRRFQLWEMRSLDLKLMKQAASFLEGRHNFQSFMNRGRPVDSAVREIKKLRLKKKRGVISISVLGTGFLYNQVRILVGTLLEVGLGKREPGSMKELLEAKDRSRAGPTAPAHGLNLEKTIYPGDKDEKML